MKIELGGLGALVLSAAALTGCSEASSPPNPSFDYKINYIVDCQKGPYKGQISYDLEKGKPIDVGGITSKGAREDMLVVLGDTGYEIYSSNPDTESFPTEKGFIKRTEFLEIELSIEPARKNHIKGTIFVRCVDDRLIS